MKYKIIFDAGKPYEIVVNSDEELKKELTDFYDSNKDNSSYMDAFVYNSEDEDISESQFISEMIAEIIGEARKEGKI